MGAIGGASADVGIVVGVVRVGDRYRWIPRLILVGVSRAASWMTRCRMMLEDHLGQTRLGDRCCCRRHWEDLLPRHLQAEGGIQTVLQAVVDRALVAAAYRAPEPFPDGIASIERQSQLLLGTRED